MAEAAQKWDLINEKIATQLQQLTHCRRYGLVASMAPRAPRYIQTTYFIFVAWCVPPSPQLKKKQRHLITQKGKEKIRNQASRGGKTIVLGALKHGKWQDKKQSQENNRFLTR